MSCRLLCKLMLPLYGLLSTTACALWGFRYTGYVRGKTEVHGRTPILCQVAVQSPKVGDFLHTREAKVFVTSPHNDPCNMPETYKPSTETINLWPNLQHVGEYLICWVTSGIFACYELCLLFSLEPLKQDGRTVPSPLRVTWHLVIAASPLFKHRTPEIMMRPLWKEASSGAPCETRH